MTNPFDEIGPIKTYFYHHHHLQGLDPLAHSDPKVSRTGPFVSSTAILSPFFLLGGKKQLPRNSASWHYTRNFIRIYFSK
jgi:hypothetical protein